MSAPHPRLAVPHRGSHSRALIVAVVDDGTLAILERSLLSVRARVRAAAERSGRRADAVTLVAITKSVDPGVAEGLLSLGQVDLGENRVQQLERKAAAVPGARWHLVGPVQANKARKALRAAALLHAIDDADLLPRLDRIAGEDGRAARVLLEVNVSGEAAKHGLAPADVEPALEKAAALPRVEALGLMTMAPLGAPEPELRRTFAALRALRDRAADAGLFRGRPRERGELSMGMSGDFEVAIEEGATLVRVGTALFEALPPRVAAA